MEGRLAAVYSAQWGTQKARTVGKPPPAASTTYRCASWSGRNLLAFTSPVLTHRSGPDEAGEGGPGHVIYIMEAGRPGEVVAVDTQHTCAIRHLAWEPTRGLLASVDAAGSLQLWAPVGHCHATWSVVHTATGGDEVLHVQWLTAQAELKKPPRVEADFDCYELAEPPGPPMLPGAWALAMLTATAKVVVVYPDPATGRLCTVTRRLPTPSGAIGVGSIGLYAENTGQLQVCAVDRQQSDTVHIFALGLGLPPRDAGLHVLSASRLQASGRITSLTFAPRTLALYVAVSGEDGATCVQTYTWGQQAVNVPDMGLAWKEEVWERVGSHVVPGHVVSMALAPATNALALLLSNASCLYLAMGHDMGEGTELGWWRPQAQGPAGVCVCVSPSEACVALIDAAANVTVLDVLTPVLRPMADSQGAVVDCYRRRLQQAVARGVDGWDIAVTLHMASSLGPSPTAVPDLLGGEDAGWGFGAVAGHVAHSLLRALSKTSGDRRAVYMQPCLATSATILGWLGRPSHVMACNLQLQMGSALAAFRQALASPPPPHPALSFHALVDATENLTPETLEDVLGRIHFDPGDTQLECLGQWVLHAVVFFLRSMATLLACASHGQTTLTRHDALNEPPYADIPGASYLYQAELGPTPLRQLRELLLYAIALRQQREDRPGHTAGTEQIKGLVAPLRDITRKDRPPFYEDQDAIMLDGLREALYPPSDGDRGPQRLPRALQPFSHAMFGPTAQARRLGLANTTPRYGPHTPTGHKVRREDGLWVVGLTTDRPAVAAGGFDAVRQCSLLGATALRECWRCGRVSGAESSGLGPSRWQDRWAAVCLCGGPWRTVQTSDQ